MAKKYNSEGYYDPTAYEATKRIEKHERKQRYRPIVFICSPYSGDTVRNIEMARKYCRFAVDTNCIPIAPHLFFHAVLGRYSSGRKETRYVHGKSSDGILP